VIKENKYDAVVLQSWTNLTWWLAFFACLKFHTPVLFLTDTNIFSDLQKSRLKISLKKILLGKFIFKKANGFFASGKANEQFYKAYGVPERKIVKLPHWWGYEELLVKAQQLKPEREKIRDSFNIRKTDVVFLYAGRFAKEKGLFDLIDAFNKVVSQKKKIFFVGDGSLRHQLERRVKQLKLKEIYFTGFQPQEILFKFYTMADVFVLPSKEEPWGMVVAEAMCFGLPVITSDRVGAAMDLVKDGYNGFIFSAGNSKELANCIEKLINLSSEERLLFGKRSKEIITQWINSVDPVQQILKMLKIIKNSEKFS
jgi:glycosyltransferase involved in cell wall biosynthesis